MTTLTAALKGIRAEISDTIRETGPQERVSAGVAAFKEHDYADKGQPIEEIAGPARLFEIKEPVGVDNPMDGGDTTRQQWQIDVVFCYPRESKWFSIARGDIEKIRLALLNDHGGHGVSGVSSRWVIGNPGDIPADRSSADPWDYYTLPIAVITETTAI